MKVPNKKKVQISNSAELINGLVCSVQLLTYHKNNFSIGNFKTNDDGYFLITSDQINSEVKAKEELFIMDYDSSEENFTGKIKIIIDTLSNLRDRVGKIEVFYPDKADELRSLLINSSNGILNSDYTEIVDISESISIDLSNFSSGTSKQ